LAFDFAPDEVADIYQDALQLHQPQQTPRIVELGAADSPETLSEIDALEEAMAQAARENAARDSAKRARESELEVSTVQGVELSSIVIVKRKSRFFITKKELP
jgi:hypothetical protein